MMVLSFEWRLPRWQKAESDLSDIADHLGLEYSASVKVGWVFERGAATVRGTPAKCAEFRRRAFQLIYGSEDGE